MIFSMIYPGSHFQVAEAAVQIVLTQWQSDCIRNDSFVKMLKQRKLTMNIANSCYLYIYIISYHVRYPAKYRFWHWVLESHLHNFFFQGRSSHPMFPPSRSLARSPSLRSNTWSTVHSMSTIAHDSAYFHVISGLYISGGVWGGGGCFLWIYYEYIF